MKWTGLLLSHLTVVLSLCVLVLLIVDRLNPTMGFLSNTAAAISIAVLCIAALLLGLLCLLSNTNHRR